MKKLLRTIQGEISTAEPMVVVLPDSVEDDITFKFYLRKDATNPNSYTSFLTKSATEAEIAFCNVPEKKNTSVKDDIRVGTYQNKYNLYFNYVLFCKTSEEGSIIIKFFIEEM